MHRTRGHLAIRPLPVLGAAFLVALALLLATGASANPDIRQKRDQARAILGQIDALDAQAGAAAERWNGAKYKLGLLDGELRTTRRDLRRARVDLRRARSIAAARLVALYKSNEPSTLDVVLSASSFQEALDDFDTHQRVAEHDAAIARSAAQFGISVQSKERRIAAARTEQAAMVDRLATERAAIEANLAERQRLLASVHAEVKRLEAEEQARQAALRRRAVAELARQRQAAAEARVRRTDANRPDGQPAVAEQPAPSADPTTTPAPTQAPAAPPPPEAGARGTQVVAIAMRYLGVPYKWGGASPSTGFDCSGFTMYVFAQIGVSLPHYAAAQYGMGVSVDKSSLAPGDLVFFSGLGHMGMYIGGGNFIHAPHTGDVVKISSLSDGYYTSNWVGARRVL